MIDIIREHRGFGNIIFKLAKVDLIKTYRGSALGWSWAIIKPTVTILVYWFTFSVGLRSPSMVAGYPFFLWLIAGIVPWFYMSEMITQGVESIRGYKHLVTKMNFPVSTIPTFVSLSKMFVNLCMIGIVIVIFILLGYYPDIYILQLPIYLLMSYVLFTSWALFASPLAAISKDFTNLVKAFVTPIFWLSGVIWDSSKVSNPLAEIFFRINPVTYLTRGFRDTFIYKRWFFEDYKGLIVFCVITLIMFILGVIIYKKLRKDIPDVL